MALLRECWLVIGGLVDNRVLGSVRWILSWGDSEWHWGAFHGREQIDSGHHRHLIASLPSRRTDMRKDQAIR